MCFPLIQWGQPGGVGGLLKGYHQDQLLFAGTVFGSTDDAKGFIGGMWGLPPALDGSVLLYRSGGQYQVSRGRRAYAENPRRPSSSRPYPAGSNQSSEDNYIEDDGNDNWLDLKLEYVLPIGSMKQRLHGRIPPQERYPAIRCLRRYSMEPAGIGYFSDVSRADEPIPELQYR